LISNNFLQPHNEPRFAQLGLPTSDSTLMQVLTPRRRKKSQQRDCARTYWVVAFLFVQANNELLTHMCSVY